ncbi:hypothetical protein DL769_003806 [Monosporascus sp. CRB-8-3]|nr:hypothetical protein DL769_003806 [Monosporascus sp. CRB-8-3]
MAVLELAKETVQHLQAWSLSQVSPDLRSFVPIFNGGSGLDDGNHLMWNLEYIVFDSAHIIPVFVMHINWSEDNAEHFESCLTTLRSRAQAAPETAILARASKFFPYGYGHATGGRFGIEEVVEVDEDEKDFGEYQAYRGEEVKNKPNLDIWSWVRAGEKRTRLETLKSQRIQPVSMRMSARHIGRYEMLKSSVVDLFPANIEDSKYGHRLAHACYIKTLPPRTEDVLRVAEPKGRNCAELDVLFEREINARKYETTAVDVSLAEEEEVLEND